VVRMAPKQTSCGEEDVVSTAYTFRQLRSMLLWQSAQGVIRFFARLKNCFFRPL
jgi:hypothetical protein